MIVKRGVPALREAVPLAFAHITVSARMRTISSPLAARQKLHMAELAATQASPTA